MICLSGIPGTGKTTICRMLKESGVNCVSADEIAEKDGCLKDEEVDIDCLRNSSFQGISVLESHYSHLLKCDYAIILEAPVEEIEARLRERGYPESKIAGNIDALLSGMIYSEALENLPSTRIRNIDCGNRGIDEVFFEVSSLIEKLSQTKS